HLRPPAETRLRRRRMRRLPRNPAQMDGARLLRVLWIADVVLLELASAPAGDVQPPVIDGEIDVADQRRHGTDRMQRWRKLRGLGRLGGDRDHLPRGPPLAVAVPEPDRRREVLDA